MSDIVDNWCLESLFKNENEIDDFASNLKNKAIEFEKKYNNNLNSIDFNNIDLIIKEYEHIYEGIGKISTYTFLLFAQDTTKGAFYAKYELIVNDIENHIIFFEIELANLNNDTFDKCIKISNYYSYFLLKLKERKKYQLNKEQEQLLLKLSPISTSAFSRLFDEYMSSLKFNFNGIKIGEEEILSKLHDNNRNIRKKAQKELTKKLNKSSSILRYIINIVRKDLRISKDLRGYSSLESFRHINNQITQKSVDSMIEVINNNFNLVSKYYNIKSKLIGIDRLKDYDRYAPIFNNESEKYSYDDAKNIVIETFMNFSSVFGNIVKKAFNDKWVDSHPKINKRGGAFSHSSVPSSHPYVLLNYTGKRRDVFTIAHEFGHAIHQELSKNVGYLNMDTPLTTAETASVFGEMLLFDRMKQNLKDKELITLYAGKIEDIFATLFRQTVMTNFERKIHNIDGELDVKTLNKIWIEENRKMFGDSLKLTKKYALWWSYIPHFIHSPFYCYAYSYGQLLSLALFGLYKNNSDKFVDNYIEFLSAGGSKTPRDLVSIFGFDIEDCNFWQYGMKEVTKILDEFSSIVGDNYEI